MSEINAVAPNSAARFLSCTVSELTLRINIHVVASTISLAFAVPVTISLKFFDVHSRGAFFSSTHTFGWSRIRILY